MAGTIGYGYEPVGIGQSRSQVYRLTAPDRPSLFIKMSHGDEVTELEGERDRLYWLATRAPVPRLLDFGIVDDYAYLLTEALPGENATEVPKSMRPRIAVELAARLRDLHSIDPATCPFDESLDRVLPRAAARTSAGLVDESDFDAERKGAAPLRLLDQLRRERPPTEDIVVTHGDACLPNAIFRNGLFSGFVDCGRCGLADRHQDLALAHRSIMGNFGSESAGAFLAAYGLDRVDASKLAYYRLLDEFF